MKIYTRGGDSGETSLIGSGRVRKSDDRLEAYGTVDELNSVIGLARAVRPDAAIDAELAAIQHDLFEIGSQLAAGGGDDRFPGVGSERINAVEANIDTMESELEPLRNFILPGGSELAARLHVARTVCRRAERLIVALRRDDLATTLAYINRLSDWMFVAARFANRQAGVEDVPWKR